MKVGTKSALFGAHWPPHILMVILAWKWLYGKWPEPKELVAIALHDIGYFGCPNMDGKEGTDHPKRGAAWAKALFGLKYGRLVSGHSKGYAQKAGIPLSKLYGPDKVSHALESLWCYTNRTRLTGELAEYRATPHGSMSFLVDPSVPDEEWFRVARLCMVSAGIDHVLETLFKGQSK